MKRAVLGVLGIAVIASVAFAGTETYSGKEIKQVAPPPCPEWYADQEFNVGLWGTYVFTANDWPQDRYLDADHAWGGGIDLKYFFHRYFGVGIEGWAVDARRAFVRDNDGDPISFPNVGHTSRAVGAVLGTLTLRYPIPVRASRRTFSAEAVESSAAASAQALTSLTEISPTTAPRPGRSASSAAALKFVSRRISAGSAISAGTWSMAPITTSAWCAPVLTSPSKSR